MNELERLREKAVAVVIANKRVLEIEQWTKVFGVYRSEADYLIAIRGANKALAEAIADMAIILYAP